MPGPGPAAQASLLADVTGMHYVFRGSCFWDENVSFEHTIGLCCSGYIDFMDLYTLRYTIAHGSCYKLNRLEYLICFFWRFIVSSKGAARKDP